MQDEPVETEESDLVEQLRGVVRRMVKQAGASYNEPIKTLLGQATPFDHSKPNQHDSKAEFLREKKIVSECLNHLAALIDLLGNSADDPENTKTLATIRGVVDYKLFRAAPRALVRDPIDLARKNVADVGGSAASLFVLMDLRSVMKDRLGELINQEEQFWNQSHRPPDHYARAIALRLARVYAKEIGQRPTVGTSGETGDPSTSYTRALKEVFDLLDIKAVVRAPAVWAISQLSDDDLQRAETDFSTQGIMLGRKF